MPHSPLVRPRARPDILAVFQKTTKNKNVQLKSTEMQPRTQGILLPRGGGQRKCPGYEVD